MPICTFLSKFARGERLLDITDNKGTVLCKTVHESELYYYREYIPYWNAECSWESALLNILCVNISTYLEVCLFARRQ